ncbi:MAG: polymer-forming cytoskeletal protein, partial [Anaerolineae bacterium]|nr:polymer-forming cytoskeletal protein [Anaerolineae bacterium]
MHKHKIVSLTFAVLCVLMTTVAPVLAQEDPPQSDGQFIWNDDYTLEAGERVEGDLVVFNGDVVLKDGSSVEGSVVVWNGNADVDGRIDGELVVSNG